MNVGKMELYRNLKIYPGARWDQSPLFKAIYESEFGTARRRALWRADRRLSFQPLAGRRVRFCAISPRSPRPRWRR